MAHCGLQPQSIHQLGGYRVQRNAEQLLADVKMAQEAGAFAVVLECIPAELANRITAAVSIPTIGIGAGAGCDGQILVFHDLLGLTPGRLPRHVKAYADLSGVIPKAVRAIATKFARGFFPARNNRFLEGDRGRLFNDVWRDVMRAFRA